LPYRWPPVLCDAVFAAARSTTLVLIYVEITVPRENAVPAKLRVCSCYMWEAQVLSAIKTPLTTVGNLMMAVAPAAAAMPLIGPVAAAALWIGGLAASALGNSIQVNPTTGERSTKMTDQAGFGAGTSGISSLLSAIPGVGVVGSVAISAGTAVATSGFQFNDDGRMTGYSLEGRNGEAALMAGAVAGIAAGVGHGIMHDASGNLKPMFNNDTFGGKFAQGLLNDAISTPLNVGVEYYKFKNWGAENSNYAAMARPDASRLGSIAGIAAGAGLGLQFKQHIGRYNDRHDKALEAARQAQQNGNDAQAAYILAGLGYSEDRRRRLLEYSTSELGPMEGGQGSPGGVKLPDGRLVVSRFDRFFSDEAIDDINEHERIIDPASGKEFVRVKTGTQTYFRRDTGDGRVETIVFQGKAEGGNGLVRQKIRLKIGDSGLGAVEKTAYWDGYGRNIDAADSRLSMADLESKYPGPVQQVANYTSSWWQRSSINPANWGFGSSVPSSFGETINKAGLHADVNERFNQSPAIMGERIAETQRKVAADPSLMPDRQKRAAFLSQVPGLAAKEACALGSYYLLLKHSGANVGTFSDYYIDAVNNDHVDRNGGQTFVYVRRADTLTQQYTIGGKSIEFVRDKIDPISTLQNSGAQIGLVRIPGHSFLGFKSGNEFRRADVGHAGQWDKPIPTRVDHVDYLKLR
jgi:hypothetical protein